MAILVAIGVAALFGAGTWLVLRAQTWPVILGLSLISYGTNVLLSGAGSFRVGLSPIIAKGVDAYPDPVPQALVLTAIVIGFAMTAFVLVLALKARFLLGSDHVDGAPTDEPSEGQP